MNAMHFSGGLRVRRGGTMLILSRGWAACVSGERTWKIRELGNQTCDRDAVTCKRCLKLMRLPAAESAS